MPPPRNLIPLGNGSALPDRDAAELVNVYLAAAHTARRLTYSEERRLLQLVVKGDEEALRRVTANYLPRVARIALELRPAALSPLESIQEANLVVRRLLRGTTRPLSTRQLRRAIASRFQAI